MNKKQMDALLVKAVKSYVIGISEKELEKVPDKSEFEVIENIEISYKAAEEKIMLFGGKILEEKEKINCMIVRINAGVANANECIMVLHISEGSIEVCGYAKEGLIKQHTTSKAIKKIKQQFSN